ncbi:FtsX-like permease family protein [Fulvivirgaceae bacterium BMA10]|uniref:FtsX-like permease family protein n=1 Tax=Splendidivirga corallicola TaxID=3051826 RepID=A0ABT8KT58_9BACT|nr:FtsX-like permease family protein [Fulvivirgaceae bacterium BMA10]
MASVVFAVLLAILLNSIKEGVLYKLQENVVTFYTGAVQIHQNGYWEDQRLDNSFAQSDSLFELAKAHPDVNAVVPRLETFVLAASEKHTRGCMVVGIDPQTEPLVTSLDQKIVQGSYLENNDQGILLSEGLAEYLKLGVNDTVVLLGQGYHGVSATGKYAIRGLIKFASPELNKRMAYLPMHSAQNLFGAENRFTALVLDLTSVVKAEKVEEELALTLEGQYEVMNWKTLLPELNQVLEGERAENVIFLMVLYLLISFGIFGTILMMIVERQYEFGILVAIGMRKLKLSRMVIFENVMISVIGAIIGTVLSVPVVGYFYRYPIRITGKLEEAYRNFGFEPIFYFSIEPRIFYSQTIVVLSIALILSIYPLIKIMNIKPVESMRQ